MRVITIIVIVVAIGLPSSARDGGARPGPRPSVRARLGVVADVAVAALALVRAAAVGLPGSRPVRAPAVGEVLLVLLASLHAELQRARGAHEGLAHHDVKPGLPAAQGRRV